MKTLANYHVFNHCVIGEKTFQNIRIGPDKLPGLSRNGPQIFSSNWFKVFKLPISPLPSFNPNVCIYSSFRESIIIVHFSCRKDLLTFELAKIG